MLRRAVAAAPGDAVARLSLAQGLLDADIDAHAAEADALSARCSSRHPAARSPTRPNGPRPAWPTTTCAAAMARACGPRWWPTHLREALRTYAILQGEQRQALFPEAATLGEKSLRVNDPAAVYRLQTLPGTITALQLACLIHLGAQQRLNGADSGFGFGGEYQEAVRVNGKRKD